MKLFTIYDSKCEAYEPPISIKSTGEALRAVEIAVKEPDHRFCKYKADLTLYELGEFNEQTGLLHLYETKKHIMNLSSFN